MARGKTSQWALLSDPNFWLHFISKCLPLYTHTHTHIFSLSHSSNLCSILYIFFWGGCKLKYTWIDTGVSVNFKSPCIASDKIYSFSNGPKLQRSFIGSWGKTSKDVGWILIQKFKWCHPGQGYFLSHFFLPSVASALYSDITNMALGGSSLSLLMVVKQSLHPEHLNHQTHNRKRFLWLLSQNKGDALLSRNKCLFPSHWFRLYCKAFFEQMV